jgi:DNA-directed RNA polymerase subunit K/omega
MDYKKSTAAKTTITRDKNELDRETNNIYEAIVVLGKRANQIGGEIKEELHAKLSEFASNNESLDEVFENKEQIEVSRFYERLPKPVAIALDEWEANNIYHRDPSQEEDA